MRIVVAGFVVLAVPLAAGAQPTRTQFRCEVPPFTGAMSAGAHATMTVVSDGLACTLTLYGVPAERRNLATDGELTEAPQHGTASMLGPGARYIAIAGTPVGTASAFARWHVMPTTSIERSSSTSTSMCGPYPFNRNRPATSPP